MDQRPASRPAVQEVEVTIFGPGFGESILVHATHNDWIIVDSCIESATAKPAVLGYLEEIGVDPSTAVKLVVATHWHDDHIGGMAAVVSACTSARFACSMALTRREFLEVATAFAKRPLSNAPIGVSEILQTLSIIKSRRQYPIYAVADRPLLKGSGPNGINWQVTALSPVDAELARFIAGIAALMPKYAPAETKSRLPDPAENDISVATWVQIGCIHLLLGANLEEHKGRGWSAVLASAARPAGTASVFKIAHHGSENGHHDEVWSQLLFPNPQAVLTPWTLAKSRLPTDSDVQRIKNFTKNAYSTSRFATPPVRALDPTVRSITRERKIKIRQLQPPMGFIRLRALNATSSPTQWTLTASDEAIKL
jgi:hypothetical protein